MLTLLVATLLKVLLFLGAGVLTGMIVYFATLVLKKILGRIKEFLSKNVGGTYFACRMEKMVNELRKQAQKEGNVTKLDDLLGELKLKDENGTIKDGIIEATIDKDGKIKKGDIKIMTADQLDDDLKTVLNKHIRL